MTDFLRCPSCNMTFKSSLLLDKHREKFCIGGDIGKARETQTPQDMVNRLKHMRRKNEENKLKEMTPSDSSESKSKTRGSPKVDSRAQDHEVQLRHLAEAHSKQINEIMAQNRLLEKQRDDIVQRLNEITAQSRNAGYLEKMIRHLSTQEQKNELLLATMKQQIDMLQMEALKRKAQSRQTESLATRKTEKASFHQAYIPFYSGGSLSAEISALRLNYLQNGGNDQMILAHLQDLLAEAQHIEQREKHVQPIRKKSKKSYEPDKWRTKEKVIKLEIENQQLEDQLFQFQLQNQKGLRFPKTTNGEIERGVQFPRFIKEQTNQKIKSLDAELEVLKQELEIQRLKRCMKTATTRRAIPQQGAFPPVQQNKPDTPNFAKHLLNFNSGLEPAPYDPITGFVVFYDYALGLDPTYQVCRLAVTLCNGGQEMGSPTPLPPVYCEAGNYSTSHDSNKQNVAILATKQAVPRVRPSPNISLVIELQASGGYDPYGQEVSRLIPRGWVKLDIFDYQNRVISGRWKVPIRILPVKPSLTTGSLNGVPQLENAELYIRLVNARDADTQSLYPIDINNSLLYKYPPLTAASFSPDEDFLQLPYYSSPYAIKSMQTTYGDDVDSPPPQDLLMTP
ncbi:coiled-coil domain-containing protein 17-like [Discoglossus pictus]